MVDCIEECDHIMFTTILGRVKGPIRWHLTMIKMSSKILCHLIWVSETLREDKQLVVYGCKPLAPCNCKRTLLF